MGRERVSRRNLVREEGENEGEKRGGYPGPARQAATIQIDTEHDIQNEGTVKIPKATLVRILHVIIWELLDGLKETLLHSPSFP